MGNAAGKHHPGGKKYVHWDAAVPPAPPGKPQLVPGTPNSQPDLVTISWEPPINDGGAPVTGYLVEHRRTGSPHWVRSMPSLVPVPELTLSGLEPGWRYQFRVSAKNAAGMSEPGDVSEPLTVTLNRSAASAPHFVQELHDTIALENETAEFKVHFRGTPTPKLAWYKDGFEIFSSRRMKVVTEGDLSTLVIYQTAFSDEGEIKCTATNRVGHVVTRAKLRLEAPPSIRIPRQYEDGLLFEMGEIIRLKVSVAGRPLPRVTWFHNGEQVMFGGRYEVTNTDRSSSIRVAEARRADRGEYQIRATNRLGEDVASFLVTVTDRPMPPGKAQVVTTLGRSVTLSWSMPEDDGGCKIGNYIVEYYRIGWNVWLKAATCRQLSTTLGDLIEGSEYKFRVKAENPYGVSDPSEESDVVFLPDPKRGLLEPPARKRGSKTDIKVEDRKSQKPGSGRTTPQPAEEKPVAKKEIPLAGKRKEIEDIAEPPKKGAPDIRLVRSKEWETVDRPVPVIMYEDKKSHESVKQKNKENVAKNVEGTISKQSKPDLKRKEDEPPPIPPKTARKSSPLQKQAQIPAQAQVQTPTKVPTQTMAVPKTKPISPNASVKKQSQEENARRGSLVDEKAKKSHLLSPNTPLTPREDDDSIMHGSSELMLVLLPEGESGEANRERRAQSERRFEFGNTYQESESLVAPPMSLSAPELGSGEPAITNPLRNAVSSTELLHEKAMARFYQAVAAEEAEKARKRRQSIERPTSTTPASTRLSSLEYEDEEVKRVSKNREIGRERLSSIEDEVELRKTLKEKSLQNQQIDKSPLQRRLDDNRTDIKLLTPQEGKGPSKLLTQEEEQEEFSRIRERLNKGEVGQRKGQIRQTSQEEMEEDDDEDLDEEDSLDESIDYDDDEDEPYHPRSFIPQTELRAKIEPTFLSFDRDVYSEDDEEDTYHPMSMIPRQVVSLAVPSETEVKPEVEPAFVPIQATETISSKEPLPDLDRKNNIEVPSDFAVLRSSTSPSPSVESDIVVRRRKKEPPPTQTTEAIGSGKEEAQLHDDDVGLTAGEIARKRRLQARQSSLEEEANLQRVVSSHYDDFIREFGRTKKRQVQLYTNTEDLKAAAFSSGEDVNIEDAIVETPQAEKPPVKESTILQEYEERWQKLQQKQEELAVKWKKEEISEKVQIKQSKKRGASGRERKIDKPEQKEEEILPTLQEEKTEIPRRKWWWWWWWRKERSVEDKTNIQDSPPPPPPRPPPPPPRPPISPSSPPPPPVTKMEVPTLTGEVVKPEPDMDISEGTLTPDEIKLQVAEKNVRSFIEYMSDIAMFSVACCLYIFENEILAIPLLVLMVYRQTCQAIKRKIPAKWRRSR